MRLLESSTEDILGDGSELWGNAFLVEEKRPRLSFQMSERLVSEGGSLLMISRDPPEGSTPGLASEPKRFIWLTNLVGKDRMNPTAIGLLMAEIKRFIDQEGHPFVLLDGLEYLISVNTFDRMLQFVHQLRDVVVMTGSVLIIPLDTRTLSERELALLERNLQVVIPGSEHEHPDGMVGIRSGIMGMGGQR